jgi:hypothetical protein
MTTAFLLALLLAAPTISVGERVEGARVVERARYAFVIGTKSPFDEVYPRAVFQRKVEREQAAERVLLHQFGMQVTPDLLAAEYERIEKETRAPDQWAAIRQALGDDHHRVEEIVCRPLLVDRALRARFAFDQAIHAAEHQDARLAREVFLAGGRPAGVIRLRLSRRGKTTECADQLLARAQAEAVVPKLLTTGRPEPKANQLLLLAPAMMRVLETELKTKGAVTTILEERDRFSVFRLVDSEPSEWLVDAVQVLKRDFDRWLDDLTMAPTRPGLR